MNTFLSIVPIELFNFSRENRGVKSFTCKLFDVHVGRTFDLKDIRNCVTLLKDDFI